MPPRTQHAIADLPGSSCICGCRCPLCASPRHDTITVDAEHAFLYCHACCLEFRDDHLLVRYADGDAPYRRVRDLLASIEAVAMAANHVVIWSGGLAICARCATTGRADDGEAHLNGYPAGDYPLARPCKRP